MLPTRLLSVAVLLALAVPAAGQQPTLEYDVKAAFILNFVRYGSGRPSNASRRWRSACSSRTRSAIG